MEIVDWQDKSASLFYLLYSEKRFDDPNGSFFVVYDNNEIVAVSGVYISDFNKDIAIGGVRTWTLKSHRIKYVHGNIIIPGQIEWSKKKKMKMFLLTFNDYNDWLFKFILRGIEGKATAFGLKFSDTYKNFKLHDRTMVIKNTTQYVLKMPLEKGFDIE